MNLKSKKILVTGCAGFIGAALSKRFLSANFKVIGIDNLNNYYDIKLKSDRLKVIEDFIKDRKYLWEFFKVSIENIRENGEKRPNAFPTQSIAKKSRNIIVTMP